MGKLHGVDHPPPSKAKV